MELVLSEREIADHFRALIEEILKCLGDHVDYCCILRYTWPMISSWQLMDADLKEGRIGMFL